MVDMEFEKWLSSRKVPLIIEKLRKSNASNAIDYFPYEHALL